MKMQSESFQCDAPLNFDLFWLSTSSECVSVRAIGAFTPED
jgi:hypothetical protein